MALYGCSSSDKAPAPSTPGPGAMEAGHEEAGVKYTCKAPMDLMTGIDTNPTGFVVCANGVGGPLHRTEIKECPSALPRSTTCFGVGSGTDSGAALGICKSDSDCTTGHEGHCQTTQRAATCACYYGCKSDADCSADRICVCGNPTGQCELAKCRSDADCGPGKLCLSASNGACSTVFACQTVKDTCAGDRDCPPTYSQCTFDGDHRVCKAPPNCGI
jgi:hypothetical protein